MISPKPAKQAQLTITKSSPDKAVMMTVSAPQDRIRERAYELYESRGCEPGQDKEDWLRAEQQILKPKQ
ncbi:MAG: DUF2934 domain-containing protein [Terriglobales bacterium]|jgi:hypothetical protein